jgi:hypothetical protein
MPYRIAAPSTAIYRQMHKMGNDCLASFTASGKTFALWLTVMSGVQSGLASFSISAIVGPLKRSARCARHSSTSI